MASDQPLRDPPVIDTAGLSDPSISLVAAPVHFDLAGRQVWGDGYDGGFVGPTLQLEPGQHLSVTLVNHLRSPTNLHYHGMEVSPEGDSDDPFLTDPPGGTLTYHLDIPADHPQGTFWYHDHQMCMGTQVMAMPGQPATTTPDSSSCADPESQIFSGLSGTILVGDDRSLLPAGLRDAPAHTLVFKDVQIDRHGHIVENVGGESINSNSPTVRLVDGQLRPTLDMSPGQTQLWRLANEGADIFYDLALDGYTFRIIGQDGVPVSQVTTATRLLLPPGKRYDVLVTAGPHPGSAWLRTLAYSNGPQGDSYPEVRLMKLRVTGTPVPPDPPTPVGRLPTAPADLSNAPIARQRTVTLSESADGTTMYINGHQFDPARPAFPTPAVVGTVEEWTIVNTSGEVHPFHLHTNHFQVMSVNGVAQPFTGQQDIVPVPDKQNGRPGQVVIRVAFTFPGRWMFHCHIEAHADAGMMSYVDVIKSPSATGGTATP